MAKQKRTQKHIPTVRLTIAVIFITLVISAAILWILSAEHLISGIWAYILPVCSTVVAVLLALFQWLFPFSPNEAEHPLSSNVRLVDATLDSNENKSPYEQTVENGRTVIRYKGPKPTKIHDS